MNLKSMREYDNSKIHISNNSLLSICLLIMLDILLLVPSNVLHYVYIAVLPIIFKRNKLIYIVFVLFISLQTMWQRYYINQLMINGVQVIVCYFLNSKISIIKTIINLVNTLLKKTKLVLMPSSI